MPYRHITGTGTSIWDATNFLSHFSNVSQEMKKAEDALLSVMKDIKDPNILKSYDAAHKKMVRLHKDWNRIEHEREVPRADD